MATIRRDRGVSRLFFSSSWFAAAVWTATLSATAARAEAPAAEPEFSIDVQVVAEAGGGQAVSSSPATHQQVKVLRPADDDRNLKLTSFCTTKDGRIVAVFERQDQPAQQGGGIISEIARALGGNKPANAPDAKAEARPAVAQVRILDADGKKLEQWALDFRAQAVNVSPDGNLIIGGDGVLARYELNGKQLARSDAPHVLAARKDPDGLKRRARETLEEQRNMYTEAIKNLESQKVELAKKDDAALSPEEREMKPQIDQMIAAYKQAAAQQGSGPITDADDAKVNAMVEMLSGQAQRINAVSASDKYIFCTAPASKGYGYSVWRTDLDFGNPQRIADGLSGCCGQMDIQCCGDDVVISENSRKRVVRYNSQGKQVSAWGKSSRDGEGDTFGSCCNPMNTRAVGDKLYVSDSDGRVRLFSLDGEYEGEVGKANVAAGCKSSIVNLSPDGNRLYYIDVNNSAICVLDRSPSGAPAAN